MRDRLFFPLMAILALAMIALSLLWPRGLGLASPSLGDRGLPWAAARHAATP